VEPRGNLTQAVQLYEQARQGFDPHGPDYASALMNEGNARQRLAELGVEPRGNLTQAVQLYEQARQGFDPHGPDYAGALMNEGTARRSLAELGVEPRGNLDRAVQLYEQARQGFDPHGPDFARALMNEGNARQSLAELGVEPRGNLEEVVGLYEKAAASFLALGHQRDALTAFSNIAKMARKEARAGEGDGDGAARVAAWRRSRDAWARAVSAAEAVRADISSVDARRDWLGLQAPVYAGAVEAALELGEFDQALAFAERGRGRTLIDLLNLRENRPKGVEDPIWNDYQEIVRQLAEMERIPAAPNEANGANPDGERSMRGAGTGPGTAEVVERTRLQAQLADYERRFRKDFPDYFAAAEPPDAKKIREIADRLNRIVVVPWIGADRSCAFVVRPGDPKVTAVDLPGLTTATVWEWMFGSRYYPAWTGWFGDYLRYRATSQPRTMVEYQAHVAARRAWFATMTATLDQVHRSLVAPIDQALGNQDRPKRVALLAGGLLGLLPLHAARPGKSDNSGESSQCWLDRVEVIYGPSIAVLGRCEERARPRWSPVLGVIDPRSNLWFSRWEGAELGKRVKERGGEYLPLFLEGAKLDVVRKELGARGLVHFACHGGWNPSDPLESGLETSDGTLKLGELLREKSCDDARLVTLSACETGLGHDFSKRDEEYLGLPAGFLLGGAKAVVGSLWTVDDRVTALLMNAFYRNLFEGKGLAESLQKAQIWLRSLTKTEAVATLRDAGIEPDRVDRFRQFLDAADDAETLEHPYYWAGFAAYGAGGPVIS
ncbi:MAG: CHAT domain-containing protein, partial [Isosphaeraceae bacterium]